jgi:DNA-binding beta-propeller fold protein YncE
MTAAAAALALAALGACGAASDSDSAPRGEDAPGSASDGGVRPGAPGPNAGQGQGGGGGAGGAAAPPPEREEQRELEAPRAGARFVYVANPRRDTVAVIDPRSLAIRTVAVGDTPGPLGTAPGKDLALVLNLGTRDVSVLRTDAAGATRVTTVPAVTGANTLSIAPDGRHAIAWFDSAQPGAIAAGGTTSFQDVALIALADEKDTATRMTVGFRPSRVVFSEDGAAAFVVTEDGISIIPFAEVKTAAVARLVRLPEAPGASAARDFSVTRDGKYAIARREGSNVVELVDLASGAVRPLDLGSPVTDLDLAPSGQFALAMLRAESAYVRIALPGGFTDPAARVRRTVEGEAVGSAAIAPDGARAVLYTTAGAVERVVVADLSGTAAPQPVSLRKAVRAVALAPDGKTAVVIHTKAPGDPRAAGIDVDAHIDRSYGYTVVDLEGGRTKLQLAPTEIGPMTITPDGTHAFVLLADKTQGVRIAQRIALGSFLVDEFPLGSPPLSIAALGVESRRVFVSQEHPEGRISFIDWQSGEIASVTGFELNGRIVQ